MIYSMTGYAVRTQDFEGGSLHMELKSVNSRFLDIHFRIADELRPYETMLREKISQRLGRGKIECRLYFSLTQGARQNLNPDILAQLKDFEARVRAEIPNVQALSINEVLRWPGMFGDENVDFSSLAPVVQNLCGEVLEEFVATRAREGEKLAAIIQNRGQQIRQILLEVTPRIPDAQAAFTEKLKQRLEEALGNKDDSRVLQEVALFAARIDVDEEISRLQTHLDELDRILAKGGTAGKRLDFLMQELNREANTLGSKAAVAEMTQAAMDMKLLIEQMREQVQNIE